MSSAVPDGLAVFQEACFEEADSDVAFIAKVLDDIDRAKGMSKKIV